MLISANIVKINQLSAHHGPENRTDSMIFESIYALSTIIISGYMRVLMRVFFLLSKLDKQLSKSDK